MADGSLISSFSRFLPNMKATFSIFDEPQIYLSWARRESLVDLGLRGESELYVMLNADV
jgi:beta-1,2-xylosyltransferase